MDNNERFIGELMEDMAECLSKTQMDMLGIKLTKMFAKYHVEETSYEVGLYDNTNQSLKKRFIASLRLEGKSEQTLEQYSLAIEMLLSDVNKPITDMTTNDIRYHLMMYQSNRSIKNELLIIAEEICLLSLVGYLVRNILIKIQCLKFQKSNQKLKSNCHFQITNLKDYEMLQAKQEITGVIEHLLNLC